MEGWGGVWGGGELGVRGHLLTAWHYIFPDAAIDFHGLVFRKAKDDDWWGGLGWDGHLRVQCMHLRYLSF